MVCRVSLDPYCFSEIQMLVVLNYTTYGTIQWKTQFIKYGQYTIYGILNVVSAVLDIGWKINNVQYKLYNAKCTM